MKYKFGKMIIEVCANSFESAKNAQLAGANRIELCSELGIGGITPSYGLIKKVVETLDISVHVLIRPRSGNFVYSEEEFDIMKENIELCKKLGCAAIVSGVLKEDFSLDVQRTQELIELSKPLPFVFHRAFDLLKQPLVAIEKLKAIGVSTVLTSGGAATAIEGLNTLINFQKAAGTMTIMPGSGINATNVSQFKNAGFNAIHFSGISSARKSELPKITFVSQKMLDEKLVWVSKKETLQEIIKHLSKS